MLRFVHSVARTTLVGVLLAGIAAGPASAHAVGGSRFDAPLPLPLLLIGAGATVGLTAFWLGRTDRTTAPTLERAVATIPTSTATTVGRALGVAFLLCVLLALVTGAGGRQIPAENPATVFTWAVWFRGLAIVAIVVGNPWPLLSPWRTVVDGLGWLEGEELSLLPSPPVGAWPAALGFLLIFGVVENLTNVPLVPRLTTAMLAAYAILMIGGAVLFGSSWLDRADPLGVFYRLFGAVSPVRVERREDLYRVSLRYPWEGVLSPARGPALVVFAVAMVYVVSFDGFTDTSTFQTVLFQTQEALGLGQGATLVLFAVGLAGFLGAFVAGCWLCERLGGSRVETLATARAFAPTLLPIAAAYEVSHNYPYVSRSLGQLVGIVLEPVAPGIGAIEPLGWLPLPVFWGSQVLLIVLGHVVAVVAAHFVAVERYGSLEAARRAHLPLVALMIGYTVLSLWIVSQPVVA